MPEPATSEDNLDPVTEVFHLYDPPLWLVTSAHRGERGGLIATCAVRASILADCPRMVVGIAKHHHTWGLIEQGGRFALHLLPAQELDAVWRFATQSGHQRDKWTGLPDIRTPDGNPFYGPALSWLDCRVEERLDIGDRTLYLAQVSDGEVLGPGPLLTVATLRRESGPEQLAILDRRYQEDRLLDSAAILNWRRARTGGCDAATRDHDPVDFPKS